MTRRKHPRELSRSDVLRQHWESLSDEERASRVAAMQAASRTMERSEEFRRKISESHKRLWQEGGPKFKPRACRACGDYFMPGSGSQRYCCYECKNANRHAGRYGISAGEYRELLASQMGACALCGAGKKGFTRGRPLQVDHCHETGAVRGLLCGDCNTALGRFGDDPKRLRAAARYLERHRKK